MKAIEAQKAGGPEVLRVVERETPRPGPGEALVRQEAVGVNYIDVYHRSGLYPLQLPAVIGLEGAGVVEELGEGAEGLSVGDRVAYAGPPMGGYAEQRVYPAERLVKVPEGVTSADAVAVIFKAMTAQYLIKSTFPVKPGHTIVLHAAAGGVGLLLAPWAKHLGAKVIGVVSSEEKAKVAQAHGCDHAVLTSEDLPAKVKEITGGAKADAVFDSVGKDTFEASLDCLKPRGMMVSFGNASGKVPPFDTSVLSAKGSLYLTRPTLMTYTADAAEYRERAADVLDALAQGILKPTVWKRYPLAEAAQAHRDLESRKTIGALILEP